jgi:hypothetical protein
MNHALNITMRFRVNMLTILVTREKKVSVVPMSGIREGNTHPRYCEKNQVHPASTRGMKKSGAELITTSPK